MQVQFILLTEFGDFTSMPIPIEGEDEFNEILERSKNYWNDEFEFFQEDGGYVIFTPELMKKSILKINKYE